MSAHERIKDIDLRQVLRKLIDYAYTYPARTHGEMEQAITCAMKKIQECRYCAFEKEQRERGDG